MSYLITTSSVAKHTGSYFKYALTSNRLKRLPFKFDATCMRAKLIRNFEPAFELSHFLTGSQSHVWQKLHFLVIHLLSLLPQKELRIWCLAFSCQIEIIACSLICSHLEVKTSNFKFCRNPALSTGSWQPHDRLVRSDQIVSFFCYNMPAGHANTLEARSTGMVCLLTKLR